MQAVNVMKKADDPTQIASQAEALLETYLQPGVNCEVNVSDGLRKSIESMVKGNADKEELVQVFEEAQTEIVKIMALGAFPRFLMSTTFGEYRASKTESAIRKMDSLTLTCSKDSTDGVDTRQAKMSKELNRLLVGTSWLNGLLASVENLPVCVSLAAANKEVSGFPLIYVNTAFETTTGYPRSEIIGQNCRFLQKGQAPGHDAEEESIKRMTVALREGKPLKVAITNFRKDGSPFRNLLAMKPIHDSDGRYAFVLGIQFDIGENANASAKKMKIIDDLFRLLPNTIIPGAEATVFQPSN